MPKYKVKQAVESGVWTKLNMSWPSSKKNLQFDINAKHLRRMYTLDHWIHALSRAMMNQYKTSSGTVRLSLSYIRVSASPNERFTYSLLCWLWCSIHVLHRFSRTRQDRHAHYHHCIWHTEWWQNTPAHTILPELPRYTCRWFRVGAYYLQATLQLSRSSPGRQEKSWDVIYLLGESSNTNRLCMFHFLIC